MIRFRLTCIAAILLLSMAFTPMEALAATKSSSTQAKHTVQSAKQKTQSVKKKTTSTKQKSVSATKKTVSSSKAKKASTKKVTTKKATAKKATVKVSAQSKDLASRGLLDTQLGLRVVEFAKTLLGTRYKAGGTTPKGFDCSGFVSYVFKNFGVNLGHGSAGQAALGRSVSKAELKPGDLVFFDTNGGHNSINHVGICIGNNRFINAESGSSRQVTISSLSEAYWANTYMYAKRLTI